jgi:hypothetical protein
MRRKTSAREKILPQCGTQYFQKKGSFSGFELKGHKKTIAIVLTVIIIIIILLKVMFGGRSEKQLSACELNMKSIATALAAYAIESNGIYPPSLAYCNINIWKKRNYLFPLYVLHAENLIYIKKQEILL